MSNANEPSPLERLQTGLQRTVESSRVVSLVRRARSMIADSFVSRLGARFVEYTQASFIYRWLTKEPDPEVVVIDLRETYTVGPIIRLIDVALDWVVNIRDRVAPYWDESTLNECVNWVVGQGRRVADSRIGRTIRSLIEPPKPPDGEENDGERSEGNTDE